MTFARSKSDAVSRTRHALFACMLTAAVACAGQAHADAVDQFADVTLRLVRLTRAGARSVQTPQVVIVTTLANAAAAERVKSKMTTSHASNYALTIGAQVVTEENATRLASLISVARPAAVIVYEAPERIAAVTSVTRTQKMLSISSRKADLGPVGVSLAVVIEGVTKPTIYRSDEALRAEGVSLPSEILRLTKAVRREDWLDVYRQGIRAGDFRKWSDVESYMRRASKLHPAEGEPVVIYGLRIQPYVPNFYLAVALCNVGKGTGSEGCRRLQEYQRDPSELSEIEKGVLAQTLRQFCSGSSVRGSQRGD